MSVEDSIEGMPCTKLVFTDDLNEKVTSEREIVQRNDRILPLLNDVHTGGFNADARATIANNLQNSGFIPKSMRPKIGEWLNVGDPAKAKVVENQLVIILNR